MWELIVYFSYENQKFRPQGGGPFVFISDFFEVVKIKFFRFISKRIAHLVSLNILVLESIKISLVLIFYFSMKIKDSDYRGGPFVYISDFLEVVQVKFFLFISKLIPYLASQNSLVLQSIKISWEL